MRKSWNHVTYATLEFQGRRIHSPVTIGRVLNLLPRFAMLTVLSRALFSGSRLPVLHLVLGVFYVPIGVDTFSNLHEERIYGRDLICSGILNTNRGPFW